jgi:phosphoribosyl-ATP pyrophosphohydrolase
MTTDVLAQLAETIKARRAAAADKSYTRKLLDAGPHLCAKKLGEEAVETALAGVAGDRAQLTAEAADLLYHLLVLLECRDVPLADVLAVLDKRSGTSGLDEKAARAGS